MAPAVGRQSFGVTVLISAEKSLNIENPYKQALNAVRRQDFPLSRHSALMNPGPKGEALLSLFLFVKREPTHLRPPVTVKTLKTIRKIYHIFGVLPFSQNPKNYP